MNTRVVARKPESKYDHPEHLFLVALDDYDAGHDHDDYDGIYGHGFPATRAQLETLREQIDAALSHKDSVVTQ